MAGTGRAPRTGITGAASSTGASIWSSSGRATHSVGHISVVKNRGFAFDAMDPEQAYGGLVDALVEQVTRDFRATLETR